jgi:glucose-1-phosphate thymidylyltransferase
LVIGEDFIGDDSVALVLGDNIFFANMDELLRSEYQSARWCCIAYHVSDPERYGVVEFDANLKPFLLRKTIGTQVHHMQYQVCIFDL